MVQTNQMIGWRAQVSCTARSSLLAPQRLGNLAGTANFNKPSADPVFGPFKSDQSSFCADRWSRPWHSLGARVEIRKQWQYFFSIYSFPELLLKRAKQTGSLTVWQDWESSGSTNDCTWFFFFFCHNRVEKHNSSSTESSLSISSIVIPRLCCPMSKF